MTIDANTKYEIEAYAFNLMTGYMAPGKDQPAAGDRAMPAKTILVKREPCWCGEPDPYYAPIRRTCGGSGHVDCLCGGDFCVCHNHGEVECLGCRDCELEDDENEAA